MDLKLDFPGIQTRLTDSEVDIICEGIKSAKSLSMGPNLKAFEDNFASFVGVENAFGVSSATAALELAAILCRVEEGDEVLLPAHTFAATALPFIRRKAKIVFVDIDPETFVMDTNDLAKKVTNKSKVIVPVHLYGLPVKMDVVMDIASKNGLLVVEDCAQAPGAEYCGKKVGSWGDFGCFSFHGQKNITTLGEGGMLTTNSTKYVEEILGLRKIGARPFLNQKKYWQPAMSNIIEAIPGEIPYNFAMGEIQALAGDLILKRIGKINEVRRNQAAQIIDALSDFSELSFQKVPENCLSAYHLFPARYEGSNGKTRDDLIDLLFTKYGIKTVVQYYPLYKYELFINNGCSGGNCPETDRFFDNMISFPFASDMDPKDIDYLISSTKSAMKELRGEA
ncbi:MAG: DegT/DnrJ/EryC1/StrS family aminotransferase [Bacteriovoracaceae bacterium]|jgi:perosamine synthetase|nr:DegT/DnrJ/EryC1/StrS family aminotransferase [Bacteriovoracaceae bacterium]